MRRDFRQRAETFGLDTPKPWAMPAFRLLFHVPRAYEPLVRAWDACYPGTQAALDRLVELGFVDYQPPVVIDTLTGDTADKSSPSVTRYRTTAKGRRLITELKDDLRILSDIYPRSEPQNHRGVARLLRVLDLQDSHARFGLSARHTIEKSELAPRTGRWWIAKLVTDGYVRELDQRYADTRAVVPAHWRINRTLCRQLSEVIAAFPDMTPASLVVEFRLKRSRFLDDIDPIRLGISGATDYDHDVECQKIAAVMLASPQCAQDGLFVLEPRFHLSAARVDRGYRFDASGTEQVFYQPDAEFRELDAGQIRRCVLEYERYQSRRDAWAHIERFLGYLKLTAYPFERAILRFVVDSPARVRSYRQLIEAFCDYMLDHPELLVRNQVTLAVSSMDRLLSASDALDPHQWYRIALPRASQDDSCPVLHKHKDASTPYDEYFSRADSSTPTTTGSTPSHGRDLDSVFATDATTPPRPGQPQ
jgi:hypothetical protein